MEEESWGGFGGGLGGLGIFKEGWLYLGNKQDGSECVAYWIVAGLIFGSTYVRMYVCMYAYLTFLLYGGKSCFHVGISRHICMVYTTNQLT